jgi:conjugative relaxase-like TrwC/TraI family protein
VGCPVISIGKTTSVDQAVRYLLEAQADALIDYMAGRGEAPGRWTGPGAAALELRGEVTEEALRALLNGHHPATGEQLGHRWHSQKVIAFDVTFSCPKSVSLLYALGDAATRETVLRAQAAAVDAVVEYLQEHAAWARRYNRATKSIEHTRADLVMARFVHRTARPVTDPSTSVTTIDPQLHTHVIVPTWVLRDDGSWGHLYSEPLYQHAAPAGAVGQAVLRDELVRELGIEVEVLANSCFEVVGISQQQRDEFSRRSQQIEAMEEAQGVDSFHGHKLAVTSSRQVKEEIPPGDDIFAAWRARADRVGLTSEALASLLDREVNARHPRSLDVPDARAIVGSRGLTDDKATFTRRDVVRAVATHASLGMSRLQLEMIVDDILRRDDDVVALTMPPAASPQTRADGAPSDPGMEARYSTRELISVEREMLATARARRNLAIGIADSDAVSRALINHPMLTAGQRRMVEAVCLQGGGIILVEGAAGVGKSLALDACRDAFEASGYNVVGCSLAGRAAAELQDASGIHSFTITSTLLHLRNHRVAPNTVLVVDEAGMVASRDLAELIDIAARDNVKLVAVGDPVQLQPIEAGTPFRALIGHIGAVQLTENVRQREPWEREVLRALRSGGAAAAVKDYRDHDRVRIARNACERRVQILADYMSLTASGADTVMLARRREDVARLNAVARAACAAEGRLQGPSLIVNGKVFQSGDQVICLQNSRRPITNGLRGEVAAVDPTAGLLTIRSTSGLSVRINTQTYDALDYAYALTVHKSQGLTADVGLVLGSEAATREWVYPALSRGRVSNLYYAIDHGAIRDAEGVMHWPDEERSIEERLRHSWTRSEAKDSTLDYSAKLVREIDEAACARDTVDVGRIGLATDQQRALLRDLQAADLDGDASWVRASIEIDRRLRTPLGAQALLWLEEAGVAPDVARDLVRDALVESGEQGEPSWLDRPGSSSAAVPAGEPDAGPTRDIAPFLGTPRQTSGLGVPDAEAWGLVR